MRRTQCITLLLATLFAAVLLLGGCGNKGDLYLPESDPQKDKKRDR